MLKLLSLVILSAAVISLPSFLPKTRVSAPKAFSTSAEFAQNELDFIKTIYLPYLNVDYSPMAAHWDKVWHTQNICSLALMSFANEGVSSTGPAFKLLVQNLPALSTVINQGITLLTDPFTLAISANKCLWAANMAKSAADSSNQSVFNGFYASAANLAKYEYSGPFTIDKLSFRGQTVDYWRIRQSRNFGDTVAENLLFPASFLASAAHLLPANFMTTADRQNYLTRAGELVKFAYSQCRFIANANQCPVGTVCNCPRQTNSALFTNHQLMPSASYTQSVLVETAEIAALYHQLGLPAPSWLPQSATVNSIIAKLIPDYVDGSRFNFKGDYNIVDRLGNTVPPAHNYTSLRYTVHDFMPPYTADSLSIFYDSGNNWLRAYIYQGDRRWHYRCAPGKGCFAVQTNSLAEAFNTVDESNFSIKLPRENIKINNQTVYPRTPEFLQVDSSRPAILSGTVILTYVIKDNLAWVYLCNTAGSVCRGEKGYPKNLADEFWNNPAITGKEQLWGNTRPTGIDSFNIFYDSGNNWLRAYIYQGDRRWHYRCAPGKGCFAVYTSPLSDSFSTVDQSNFSPKLPTSNIKVNTQTVYPRLPEFLPADPARPVSLSGTVILTYVIKDNLAWVYLCNTAGTVCRGEKGYPRSLSQEWVNVVKTGYYDWAGTAPVSPISPAPIYAGVNDWGHDATIQNAAYAFAAVTSGNYGYYNNLQIRQIGSSRKSRPFYPPSYDPVTHRWSWNGKIITVDPGPKSELLAPLTENLGTYINYPMIPPGLDQIIDSHTTLNLLDGYNHMVAFLLLTDKKYLTP